LIGPKIDSIRMGKDEKLNKRRIVLDALDQNKAVDQEYYRVKIKEYQLRLLNLQLALMESKHGLLVVVEGPDAAGKGGAIKRLVEKLDPRTFRVYSIVKPTQEEYQHHYLWRFWSKLPPYGQTAIFDRSWYGRVLVERVEGFASPTEWKRAYREINEFERLLVEDGTLIIKVYLHITKEAQLDRFKRREADPLKHWKITEEDWRNPVCLLDRFGSEFQMVRASEILENGHSCFGIAWPESVTWYRVNPEPLSHAWAGKSLQEIPPLDFKRYASHL
jgi:polyphosphate kinase 2 (PPK2 family)